MVVQRHDINLLWNRIRRYSRFYRGLLNSGEADAEQCVSKLSGYVEDTLEASISYCDLFVGDKKISSDILKLHRGFFPYNFSELSDIFKNEQKFYFADPHKYVLGLLNRRTDISMFINKQNPGVGSVVKRIRHKEKNRDIFHPILSSGDQNIDWLMNSISENNKKKEFFWVFLSDVHEKASSDRRGIFKYHKANSLLKDIGISERIRPDRIFNRFKYENLLYDASIKYVDNLLNRLFTRLKQKKLLENTLIVLFADHGVDVYRNMGFGSFNPAYLRVPILFIHPSMPNKKIYENCALSDIVPTVYEILGFEPEKHFVGKSVFSSSLGERIIIHENLSSGPCDFDFQNVNIAARYKDNFLAKIFDKNGVSTISQETDTVSDSGKLAKSRLSNFVDNRYHAVIAQNRQTGVDSRG